MFSVIHSPISQLILDFIFQKLFPKNDFCNKLLSILPQTSNENSKTKSTYLTQKDAFEDD